jgi:hypothetical protein
VVLTLGSPPEKGGKKRKKKTLVLTLGSPPEKGGEKNKIPGINPGQVRRLHSEPAGKGRKKKKKKKTWSCPSVEVLKPRSTPGRTDGRTDGRTNTLL